MTTLPSPRIDAQIDLGFLFATVHASIFGRSVGAHVDLDGTVLGDTGMRPLGDEADLVDDARQVRRAAVDAIIRAHREIGLEVDTILEAEIRATVARLLPLGPYADVQWGVRAAGADPSPKATNFDGSAVCRHWAPDPAERAELVAVLAEKP